MATEFYTKLFTSEQTNHKIQEKLLRNIKTKISNTQKDEMNKPISSDEIERAILGLQKNKTSGPDGIPAEFYQKYWTLFKDIYIDFIQKVQTSQLPQGKNTSATRLIYKDKGDIFLLINYRPIALMNVDVKILTKVLANRLKIVLPSIIHQTQTAVFGRKIHNTVNLVRDLIDLANSRLANSRPGESI